MITHQSVKAESPSPQSKRLQEDKLRQRLQVISLNNKAQLPILLVELISEQGRLINNLNAEYERAADDIVQLAENVEVAERKITVAIAALCGLGKDERLQAIIDALRA